MKKRLITIVMVLMTIVAGGLATRAIAVQEASKPAPVAGQMGKGWHHGHHDRHGRMEAVADVLDLTQAQRTEIKGIIKSERETMGPLLKQLRESRKELRDAALNGTFDEAKVRAIATQQAQARTEMIVSRTRMANRIFALLTPDQKTLAKKLLPLLEPRMGFDHRF
jgi:Spy/CpxP family protein refolding chaperone